MRSNILTSAAAALIVIAGLSAGPASAVVPALRNQVPMSAEAKAQLRARAEAGDPDAQMDMGLLYSDWYGQAPDYAEAIKWYRMIGEKSSLHDGARAQIARLEAFIAEHKRLYGQAQDGDGQHLYAFALHLPHGATGLDGDAPMPHWMLKAAEAGHTGAQLRIGTLYFRAAYVRQSNAHDEVAATRQYEPYPYSATDRAYGGEPIGFDDETPEHDMPNAILWLGKAAGAGDVQAQYNLGIAYAARGPTQDVTKAGLWLHRALAAQPSLPLTACVLDFTGRLRLMTTGVDANADPVSMIAVDSRPDYAAAYACYGSARPGHPETAFYLGQMLHRGQGVPRDDNRAMIMLNRARNTIYEPDALYEMSLIYRDSRTIAHDPIRAYILMTRAIAAIRMRVVPSCSPGDAEADRSRRLPEMEADQTALYARLTKSQRLAVRNELKREHLPPGPNEMMPLPVVQGCM
ncbi:SEL1-like repeat protein [Asticcacaulis solisilvae]|uniref:SEL1-like repeat protein n=1 Tax=Asticcacaulis solisilvae TaxID=1217274 RepID=UPI003FD84CA7